MADFSKILIANRGEIAVRICRTAKAMGYRTVAVYSDADANARHVRLADQAVRIGPAVVSASYLVIEQILEAAKKTGADAIHPGYGFLAENEQFAQACKEAGIVFIGPAPEAIRCMGNKQIAKERILEVGIPCIPGYQGHDQSEARLMIEGPKIGFPLMVKAAAGGGGKGMRLVKGEALLLEALRSAKSEASNAFGSEALILEKAVLDARHVEIQIFADSHGNMIHLGERDCSIQRRHQKVVEESPSPVVDEALRQKMGNAAVRVAKAVDYLGAGTVEFLLDSRGEFYFLEMNTRLQVEHPVTELVTGLDLVELQLKVAAGMPLGITQGEVKLKGHAMEVRLYAEDPTQGFLPQTGKVLAWQAPAAKGVRVDHGLTEGEEITPYYDPMLAKIISFGEDRNTARRRLHIAVQDMVFLGVKSNQGFLVNVLNHPNFIAGKATTGFIDQHFPEEVLAEQSPFLSQALSLAAALTHQLSAQNIKDSLSLQNWSSANPATQIYKFKSEGEEVEVVVHSTRSSHYQVQVGDETVEICLLNQTGNYLRFEQNGVQQQAFFVQDQDFIYLNLEGQQFCLENITLSPPLLEGVLGQGKLTAVMEGCIASVFVKVGQVVEKGETLVILEAMKMEHPIRSDISGTVSTLLVQAGQQVKAKQLLVEVNAEPSVEQN